MMQSIYLDPLSVQQLRETSNSDHMCSFSPAKGDSLYSKFVAESVRETIVGLGLQQGIVQLDCELEARIGNLQHDASKIVSKSFKWAAYGIPKLAKKTVCIADYYFFSR